MAAQQRILVDPPFTSWYFYEYDCNICRYILMNVMNPLEREGVVDVRLIDIAANRGSPEMTWFNHYCSVSNNDVTPVIKIVDRYIYDGYVREDPVMVLQLWEGEKNDYVSDDDFENAEILRRQILDAVKSYRRFCYRNCHISKLYI